MTSAAESAYVHGVPMRGVGKRGVGMRAVGMCVGNRAVGMRCVVVVLLVAGCGGGVASESRGGSAGAVVDAGAAPAVEEVTVVVAPVGPRVELTREPPPCAPDNTCAVGQCVTYAVAEWRGKTACVEGNPCAPLHCGLGGCAIEEISPPSVTCILEAKPCKTNADCDPAQPYCAATRRDTGYDVYDIRSCVADYASACVVAECAIGSRCVVTTSDPLAMRCVP